MLHYALKQFKTSLFFLLLCMLITGLIYPVIVTGLAQLFFPYQSNGSLIKQDNKLIGSALIGQYFDSPSYFWGRPSATSPYPYNAANSQGSNFGPLNPEFMATVGNRYFILKKTLQDKKTLIPIDLVTASGSGLDPHISPLAAYFQVERIALARKISKEKLTSLVTSLIQQRTFHLLGEPRVNVLELNLALDAREKNHDL